MAEFQIQHPYHSQGLAAGGSALLDAIDRGKVHLAKFILDAAGGSAVVNTRDFKGKTPLIRACYIKEEKTRDKAVGLLLARGADVNLRDDVGRTAFSYACELRCNDIVRILVKNNVDPDVPDIIGNTALMYSASVGNDIAIEILIRSFRRLGLDVNHVNDDGLTALLLAARQGFVGCASILAIEARADLNARDPQTGMTAEQLARERGCTLAEVLPFSVTCTGADVWLTKLAPTPITRGKSVSIASSSRFSSTSTAPLMTRGSVAQGQISGRQTSRKPDMTTMTSFAAFDGLRDRERAEPTRRISLPSMKVSFENEGADPLAGSATYFTFEPRRSTMLNQSAVNSLSPPPTNSRQLSTSLSHGPHGSPDQSPGVFVSPERSPTSLASPRRSSDISCLRSARSGDGCGSVSSTSNGGSLSSSVANDPTSSGVDGCCSGET